MAVVAWPVENMDNGCMVGCMAGRTTSSVDAADSERGGWSCYSWKQPTLLSPPARHRRRWSRSMARSPLEGSRTHLDVHTTSCMASCIVSCMASRMAAVHGRAHGWTHCHVRLHGRLHVVTEARLHDWLHDWLAAVCS